MFLTTSHWEAAYNIEFCLSLLPICLYDMTCAVVTEKCGYFHNGSCVEKQCILLFGCHQYSDYFLWCNSLPSLDCEIF